MGIESIADISISNGSVSVSRQGFGVMLIVDYHTKWVDRVRTYTSLAGMVSDGFATTDAAYRAAAAAFAQNPRPPKVIVGRRLLAPTRTIDITPTAVNSSAYKVIVNGLTATYTSDGSATVAEITAGLKTAIDALAQPVTTTDGTTKLTIAGAAGVYFTVDVTPPAGAEMKMQDVTANNGIATDLGDLLAASKEWYAIILTSKGKAEVEAAASWTESNKRLLLASTADEDVRTSATNDLASDVKASSYMRTKIMWHQSPHQYAEAAWAGKLLSKDPGSAAWDYKTLAGITVSSLTDTQISNLETKRTAYYITIAGVNITRESHVAGGEWLDIVLGLDWTQAEMQADIFELLASNDKVSYTQEGITMVEAVLRSVLQRGVGKRIYVDGSIEVAFPALSDISSTDKNNRKLPSGTFSAKLQGAIIAVTAAGTVSV